VWCGRESSKRYKERSSEMFQVQRRRAQMQRVPPMGKEDEKSGAPKEGKAHQKEKSEEKAARVARPQKAQ